MERHPSGQADACGDLLSTPCQRDEAPMHVVAGVVQRDGDTEHVLVEVPGVVLATGPQRSDQLQ